MYFCRILQYQWALFVLRFGFMCVVRAARATALQLQSRWRHISEERTMFLKRAGWFFRFGPREQEILLPRACL